MKGEINMAFNITTKIFKKVLMSFIIVFTVIFFVTIFADHWFIRILCPLLSMGGNVFCGFTLGYMLGGKNNE